MSAPFPLSSRSQNRGQDALTNNPGSKSSDAVAEMPGLYGPFTFSEILLQRIWARREFDGTSARTTDGRNVEILDPGRWNRLAGPDFLAARLRLGGVEMTGDVELHLHAADWIAHAHARDPAYAKVVLHVVLFPSAQIHTFGTGGQLIPVLALLPLLQRGLEEYAEDEALEVLASRPLTGAPAALAALDLPALLPLLARHADLRWRQKVYFARQRIDRLGWEGACQHSALEILGYRFNRAPMLTLAAQFPLTVWSTGQVDLVTAWQAQAGRWHRHAVRPANHPRLRLRQYAVWAAARPNWPERLRALAPGLPVFPPDPSVGRLRRLHHLPALREKLANTLCADAVGGTRFDTLVCDGFLPLLAAATGVELGGLWQCWFPGDLPESMLPTLRALGVLAVPSRPASHGVAQGLIGWRLAEEGKA